MSYDYPCRGGGRHRFSIVSGWCLTCTGPYVRDDGYVVSRSGSVLRDGPTYTQDELTTMRKRADRYLKR